MALDPLLGLSSLYTIRSATIVGAAMLSLATRTEAPEHLSHHKRALRYLTTHAQVTDR